MDPTLRTPSRTAGATPLLQTLQFLAPVALLVISLGFIPIVIAISTIPIGVLFLIFFVMWKKLTFYVTGSSHPDQELVVESGIFVHRTKSLRISRLQAVDIHRPLISRLAGYASVQVEVAGAGDSRVQLRYLTMSDAQSFRNEIIRIASESNSENQEVSQETSQLAETQSVAVSTPRWEVRTPQLIASLALTTSTYVLIAGAVISTLLAIINGAGGLTALLLTVIVSGASVITGFTMLFNFILTKNARGISISHGLISTSSYTISPIRLQALEISQPIAWRIFGWHRISMNVAGIDSNQKSRGPRILIPVIHTSELAELLHTLIPEWEIDLNPPWIPASPRARWRYPLQYAFIGTHISRQTFATRTGWLTRKIKIALHPRIQSLRITQGPMQRHLGVVSLHCDSVPGPVRLSAPGLSNTLATSMAQQELALMQQSINDDRSGYWVNHP